MAGMEARGKWSGWLAHKGKSKEQAAKEYTDFINSVLDVKKPIENDGVLKERGMSLLDWVNYSEDPSRFYQKLFRSTSLRMNTLIKERLNLSQLRKMLMMLFMWLIFLLK